MQIEIHDPKIQLAIERNHEIIDVLILFSLSRPNHHHHHSSFTNFLNLTCKDQILALIFQPLRESKFYHSNPSSISMDCNVLPFCKDSISTFFLEISIACVFILSNTTLGTTGKPWVPLEVWKSKGSSKNRVFCAGALAQRVIPRQGEVLRSPASTCGRPARSCGRPARSCGRPARSCGRPARSCGQPAVVCSKVLPPLGNPFQALVSCPIPFLTLS